MKRPRMDVNLEELDRVLDQAREAPLSEPDYDKLKSALHALAGMVPKPRTTEKTKTVFEQPGMPSPENDPEPPLIKRRATDATDLRPTAVRRKSPFHIQSYTPATHAQAVKRAKSIRRKNPGRWCVL